MHEVELLIGCEGVTACQVLTNSECVHDNSCGVSWRVLMSVSERERAQTRGQGP